MKKNILLVFAIIITAASFAQSDVKKRPSLAVHFSMVDYKSGFDVRNNSLTTVINNKQFFKFKRMDPSLSLSYIDGFTNNIDFVGTLTGGFVKHPLVGAVSNLDGNDYLLLEAAATANFKLLNDNYTVSPFFTLGAGASKWKEYYSAFAPIGVGVQVRIAEGTFMLLNSQYRVALTENAAYHFYHSVGFASALSSKKEVAFVAPALPVAPVVADRDGV
jgi:hypothetical protein